MSPQQSALWGHLLCWEKPMNLSWGRRFKKNRQTCCLPLLNLCPHPWTWQCPFQTHKAAFYCLSGIISDYSIQQQPHRFPRCSLNMTIMCLFLGLLQIYLPPGMPFSVTCSPPPPHNTGVYLSKYKYQKSHPQLFSQLDSQPLCIPWLCNVFLNSHYHLILYIYLFLKASYLSCPTGKWCMKAALCIIPCHSYIQKYLMNKWINVWNSWGQGWYEQDIHSFKF